MGILYVVSTPIGNLQDIGIRAIKILIETEIIACEDTRKTGVLLKRAREYYSKIFSNENSFKKNRLISYYEQNEEKRIFEIISLLKDGSNVALVSDSGTPAISDPGFKLIRECTKENIKIESIPGPSSVISSLVVSGLPTDKFLFAGFPPKKPGNRLKYFEKLKRSKDDFRETLIILEAPHRLIKTLLEIKNIFGDIDAVITRELTKVFEEIKRDKLSNLIAYYSTKTPKGEFIVLL
ncbi:MAG: 16S rRNA (cytidine(1402)-2'-O)-methyltransferase [Candidatus Levybacteria bacterium RIFCSPLOWO2_02_FULL_37_10]|uniref:Ribosomal RNA small subunit methyltransferase I n=1 Tax=Candidatus Blackburnbacteria bacterium RIFCSPLOWO2_01_FULL_41_27 TaxID=1797520 RepID=A0A1G1VCL1_9BACT|nr:MAG: 16S rRNA (cytidine(1402)-2'-O)-methyltransferase [Candidatus Levybacteria bacterium RIFCSPHIGHO2_01_FULL_37_33]OGH15862.1 MAG: 16S rRNA (cytidine(1402)-2'-O)-methyltransferase [Candidatus Levybacteria bacterium RIFCSPHIGHO2_02_FULL_37_11]OGH30165.1 MAG: 16S rRNA (cytidine(1402)-2'-O)-methyltransferase [Candidatus Levybacteria bacterium RIFCSPHIGHO2_12_FULL_37_12]OGH43246.1 MAG: 16S rRNA (cytidine(1402)-2'-O)-methyltransferase [Candidatus Levybacteria bacterium RIFCSPLOWO2_02_FULL_37_10]